MNTTCSWRLRRTIYLVLPLALVGVISGWVLAKKTPKTTGAITASRSVAGSAQLISYEPLPADDTDEDCQWTPAPTRVAATTLEDGVSGEGEARSSVQPRADLSSRKPARMIHDRYASFSAVAVDATNNEVVLTDENLFNVLTYNRLDNTPSKAAVTEPKRAIGGLKTKIEFQSGVYVDPKNGDIYAVNNDTVDRLVIFPRLASGDTPPERALHTPHGTFGIAVDEQRQELLLTVQHDSAVVTFQKTAKSEDSPIRLLQGEHTLLADPHGIALDAKADLIFVTNHGSVHQFRAGAEARQFRASAELRQISTSAEPPKSTRKRGGEKANWPLGFSNAIPGSGKILPPSITVYSRSASGDTAPLRVIQGPKTQMDWPTGIAFDPGRNELFVANDMGDSILVFSASASGDVAPIRVLTGRKTLIKNPTGVYIDTKNDELWVANFGNHTATVYKLAASGDTAPLRVIRSAPSDQPTLAIGNPHPVAYDGKREQLLVPN